MWCILIIGYGLCFNDIINLLSCVLLEFSSFLTYMNFKICYTPLHQLLEHVYCPGSYVTHHSHSSLITVFKFLN